MMEENNKDTNVTVEVTGADNLEVTFEEVPAETGSKGKLNVGAVALAGLAIGGTILGIRKAVRYIKERKASKESDLLEDLEEEGIILGEDVEEEEAAESPKTKTKKKGSGKGKPSNKKEEESGDEEELKTE